MRKPKSTVEKRYARIHECKEMFGISRATVYRMKDRGQIRIFKVGSVSLVKVAELEELIERNVL